MGAFARRFTATATCAVAPARALIGGSGFALLESSAGVLTFL